MASKTPEELKFEAERELLIEKTRSARVEAEIAEIELHRQRNSQDAHRIFTYTGSVSNATAQACISTLGQWHREEPETPIEVVFNSPGGSVFAGLALYDYIKELQANGQTINTTTIGMAASMAGVLLQAGDKRTVGANAYVLIHEVSSAALGNMSELEDEVKFTKRLQSRILDILSDRSTLTKRQIARRWKRKDWWLDAEEAVKLGFADAIR